MWKIIATYNGATRHFKINAFLDVNELKAVVRDVFGFPASRDINVYIQEELECWKIISVVSQLKSLYPRDCDNGTDNIELLVICDDCDDEDMTEVEMGEELKNSTQQLGNTGNRRVFDILNDVSLFLSLNEQSDQPIKQWVSAKKQLFSTSILI